MKGILLKGLFLAVLTAFSSEVGAKNSYSFCNETQNDSTVRKSGPRANVFPNPATGEILNIDLNTEVTLQFRIYDLIGSNLVEGELNDGRNTINISSLYKGIYFVDIIENDRPVKTIKIVRR